MIFAKTIASALAKVKKVTVIQPIGLEHSTK
jgi:hypothetical protein